MQQYDTHAVLWPGPVEQSAEVMIECLDKFIRSERVWLPLSWTHWTQMTASSWLDLTRNLRLMSQPPN